MTNGATERLRCKAAYAVNPTGKALQQLAARAIATGWKSAATSFPKAVRFLAPGPRRPSSGNLSGRASGAEIVADAAAAGFAARLDVRIQGDKQSVTIRPQGDTEVSAVSISLRKV
ncbi:hypothetical protein ACVBEG_27425 [Pseudomonas sp. GG8]